MADKKSQKTCSVFNRKILQSYCNIFKLYLNVYFISSSKHDGQLLRHLILLKLMAMVLLYVTCKSIYAKENQLLLPTVDLTIGKLNLKVEVANTSYARTRGLMFRKTLPLKQGMLFVFPREEKLAFWMKDTSLPLSIAFINKAGRIVSIEPLIPFSEKLVVSPSPSLYAIEVNRGVFESNGIKPGMYVNGLKEFHVEPQTLINTYRANSSAG